MQGPELQQLADGIAESNQKARDHNVQQGRGRGDPLPTELVSYMVREAGVTHPCYEGPFLGRACDRPMHMNCRVLYCPLKGFVHAGCSRLKLYSGPLASPPWPVPAPPGAPCGLHGHRCGRTGKVVGRCRWCIDCHKESGEVCGSYDNHRLNCLTTPDSYDSEAVGPTEASQAVDTEVPGPESHVGKPLRWLLRSIAEISTLADEVANVEVNPPEPSDGVPPEAWERHQRMMVTYAKAFEWTGKAMDMEAVTFGLKYDAQFPEHAFRRAYRHTPPVADFLDESVEQWLREGMCYYIYEPSPVCSPIFAVDVESDSGRRMRAVIDYHVPNEAMLDSNYPLPIFMKCCVTWWVAISSTLWMSSLRST